MHEVYIIANAMDEIPMNSIHANLIYIIQHWSLLSFSSIFFSLI
jgi:hypothetical protein